MRKRRRIVKDATYHVIGKINRDEFIFDPKQIKELFVTTIRRAKKKYAFIFKNFCIMGNHIHIIIQPLKDESLSRIMQWILSVFARRYNITYKIKGHVWYDRFKSFVIETMKQFVETFLYIANNPVKAGIVSSAYEYEYNGIVYIKRKELDFLEKPDDWVWDEVIEKVK